MASSRTLVATVLSLLFGGVVFAQDRRLEMTELNTVLMNCTFMIEGQAGPGQATLGTAFLMGRPYPGQEANTNQGKRARYVLITADHVLEEMQGDSAVLDLRHQNDDGTWVRLPLPIPIRRNSQPLWTKNPDADVAVMYVQVPSAASLPSLVVSTDLLADDATLSQFDIHPGDELFCLGFPFGVTANAAGFPILRSGRIASYPLLPTATVKTFLLDLMVFKGNSGGPVYMAQSGRMYGGAEHVGQSIHMIMGLVSQESTYNEQLVGQYSAELHRYQLGLAVVIDASVVRKTIDMLPSPELP